MTGRDSDLVLSLPCEPASVPAARHAIVDQLRAWQLESLVDAVSLAVTELATNAVLHAAGGFRIMLSRVPDGVRLEVGDDSDRMPRNRQPSALSGTGRGLQLVSTLADDWGVATASGTGKVVWAVFTAAADDSPAATHDRLADR